jgi:multidrug efflux system outer membrane protein
MAPAAATPLALLSCLCLGGCAALQPPPARERAELPTLPQAFAAQAESAGGAAPAVAVQWWRDFGDGELDRCIAAALAANYDLRAAAERVAQAAAQARLAGADLRPSISAGLSAGRQRQNFIGLPLPGAPDPLSSTSTAFGLSLDVAWELDLWGRLSAAERAAELDFAAAHADFAAAQLSLAGQVAKAYFAATAARRQVTLTEEGIATRRRTLDLVEDRFAAGLAPRLEVEQARAELAATEASRAALVRRAAAASRQLELLQAQYPDGSSALPDRLPAVPAAVPGGLPLELLARRPDLLAAEQRLAAAEARTDSARAAAYPRLALTASGGTASEDLEDLLDGDFRVWSIGGNLVQPIFEGGRIRAGIEARDAAAAAEQARFADAVLRACAEVELALEAEAELAAEAGHRAAAREAARAAEAQVEDRYRAGLENLLLVQSAARTRLEAESQALEAHRTWLENRVDLALALGGGFEAQSAEPGSEGGAGPKSASQSASQSASRAAEVQP